MTGTDNYETNPCCCCAPKSGPADRFSSLLSCLAHFPSYLWNKNNQYFSGQCAVESTSDVNHNTIGVSVAKFSSSKKLSSSATCSCSATAPSGRQKPDDNFRTGKQKTPFALLTFCINTVTLIYLLFFLYLLLKPPSFSALKDLLDSLFGHFQLDASQELLEDSEVGSCEFTVENLRGKSDIFLIGHVIGYAGKTILFRDTGFAWLISISWEFTELFYCRVLPNFVECWWDIVLFDVLICNASGIALGMGVVTCLKIPTLHWWYRPHDSDSTLKYTNTTNTLSSLTFWRSCIKQGLWVFILLFFCNTAELNSFTLKRVFGVHKNHPLNVIRLLTHAFMSYRVITNYRKFLADSLSAKALPAQFWGYLVAVVLEFACAFKHGDLFTSAIVPNMVAWVGMLCTGSVVYTCLASALNSKVSVCKHD